MTVNKLKVTGMHCKSCETILSEDLGQIKGVSNVTANHKTGTVTFEGPVGLVEDAKAVIRADGYSVD